MNTGNAAVKIQNYLRQNQLGDFALPSPACGYFSLGAASSFKSPPPFGAYASFISSGRITTEWNAA
ncbi:MAG: hypothetical protein AB9903_02600 [Vulcanimicrobiota bacterium]